MITKTVRILLTCVGVLSVGASSDAGTITFNGTAAPGTATQWLTTPYSEAGFTLVGVGSKFFIDSGYSLFPGVQSFDDDVLEFDFPGAGFTLTQDGGGTFDLMSVRTGSLGRNLVDDGNFIFTGFFAGGGSITTTVPGVATPQTYTFSGFSNLTSVVVSSSDAQFPVMDDLVAVTNVAPVPDAGSGLALLGIGIIGLTTLRRKLS